MDYKKLLGVKTSPKENFEEFYKEMAVKIENADGYELKWKLADIAIEFCDQEIPRPPDVADNPTSYYEWDGKRQKFSDLKIYYKKEKMLQSENEKKGNIEIKDKNSEKKIYWSGGNRALLELVYGLKYAGFIDGFDTNEDLREAFAKRLGFEIKNADNALSEMPSRNGDQLDEITPFFMKLDKGWKKYCAEKIDKKEKTEGKKKPK